MSSFPTERVYEPVFPGMHIGKTEKSNSYVPTERIYEPVFPGMHMAALRPSTPMVYHEKEVVTEITRCRQLLNVLKRECIISLAGEGVSMGKQGPLTLLQVGTFHGKVYIFDVLVNRDLFDKGGLRFLLESEQVLKVTFSCCFLSAALFTQFAVRIRNAFDTQIAHLTIREYEGRRLPERLSLFDMCVNYSGTGNPYGWRSDIKDMWLRKIGDFWAQRPLNHEMVEYAADDVMAFIPEVYRRQSEFLEKNKLMQFLKERVEEEIMAEVDHEIRNLKGARIEQTCREILQAMDKKYDSGVTLFREMTDDEMSALHLVQVDDAAEISEKVSDFKTQYIMRDMDNIDDDLHTEKIMLNSRFGLGDDLKSYERHDSETVSKMARRLRVEIYNIILRDIGKRYQDLSHPSVFTALEKQALRSVKPQAEKDSSIDPFVCAQHWLIVENDIDDALLNLKYGSPSLRISKEFRERLVSYQYLSVAEILKTKSRLLLELQDSKPEKHVTFNNENIKESSE